jgi:hypothetical protein
LEHGPSPWTAVSLWTYHGCGLYGAWDADWLAGGSDGISVAPALDTAAAVIILALPLFCEPLPGPKSPLGHADVKTTGQYTVVAKRNEPFIVDVVSPVGPILIDTVEQLLSSKSTSADAWASASTFCLGIVRLHDTLPRLSCSSFGGGFNVHRCDQSLGGLAVIAESALRFRSLRWWLRLASVILAGLDESGPFSGVHQQTVVDGPYLGEPARGRVSA